MEVLGLLLRVACVFALLFAVLAVLKRTEGFRAARRSSPLQVLSSTRLGKGAALTVVRIGEHEYVLGVTDHSVNLIAPADHPEGATVPATAGRGGTDLERLPASPRAGAGATADDVAAGPTARPDFAAALGARLAARLSGPAGHPASGEVQGPPTAAAFLRDAYRVARRRPVQTTDLSAAAVTAALASVRGDAVLADAVLADAVLADAVLADAVLADPALVASALVDPVLVDAAREDVPVAVTPQVPAPRTADELPDAVPRSLPPVVADGSATPPSQRAPRRAWARKDALRHQEHSWTRSSRPTARASERDVAPG